MSLLVIATRRILVLILPVFPALFNLGKELPSIVGFLIPADIPYHSIFLLSAFAEYLAQSLFTVFDDGLSLYLLVGSSNHCGRNPSIHTSS